MLTSVLLQTVFWAATVGNPGQEPQDDHERTAVSEHGRAVIRFEEKGGAAQSEHVTFEHQYAEKPLVIVSESGSSGRFLVVKAENITTTGCQVTARLLDKPANYNARIAYLVIGVVAPGGAKGEESKLPSEYGAVTVDFEKNKDIGASNLKFRHRYKDSPIVLLSECDSSGTFVVVKAQKITQSGCEITARMIDRWSATYSARIAYVVIGEIEAGPKIPAP